VGETSCNVNPHFAVQIAVVAIRTTWCDVKDLYVLFTQCLLCIVLLLQHYSVSAVPVHLSSLFLQHSVFLLLCLCILVVTYALFCIFCFHRANWHSSATLTEGFPCFFLSCKANARVQLALTGHGPHSSQLGNNLRGYFIVNFSLTTLGLKPRKPSNQSC